MDNWIWLMILVLAVAIIWFVLVSPGMNKVTARGHHEDVHAGTERESVVEQPRAPLPPTPAEPAPVVDELLEDSTARHAVDAPADETAAPRRAQNGVVYDVTDAEPVRADAPLSATETTGNRIAAGSSVAGEVAGGALNESAPRRMAPANEERIAARRVEPLESDAEAGRTAAADAVARDLTERVATQPARLAEPAVSQGARDDDHVSRLDAASATLAGVGAAAVGSGALAASAAEHVDAAPATAEALDHQVEAKRAEVAPEPAVETSAPVVEHEDAAPVGLGDLEHASSVEDRVELGDTGHGAGEGTQTDAEPMTYVPADYDPNAGHDEGQPVRAAEPATHLADRIGDDRPESVEDFTAAVDGDGVAYEPDVDAEGDPEGEMVGEGSPTSEIVDERAEQFRQHEFDAAPQGTPQFGEPVRVDTAEPAPEEPVAGDPDDVVAAEPAINAGYVDTIDGADLVDTATVEDLPGHDDDVTSDRTPSASGLAAGTAGLASGLVAADAVTAGEDADTRGDDRDAALDVQPDVESEGDPEDEMIAEGAPTASVVEQREVQREQHEVATAEHVSGPEPTWAATPAATEHVEEATDIEQVWDGPFGPGSAEAGPNGEGPRGWIVKAARQTKVYLTPEIPVYNQAKANVWFIDEQRAQDAGFRRWDNPGA